MSQDKILFVDDEINVLNAIRRAIIDESYTPFFAESASEALAIMEKNDISVIVTDMRMPVMDGLALLKVVKEKYPKTVRVVLSGYTQLSQMLATINQGEIFKFITKPWTTEEDFLPVIKQAIEYYNLQLERDNLRESLVQRNLAYQNIFRAMEQKQAQEKEELHNLHKINGWIFSHWRKNIRSVIDDAAEHVTELDEFIDVVEEVYLTYLSQLPTVIDVRTSSNLVNDIIKNCDKRLTIANSSDAEFKTQGDHKYLLMMFKILVHYVPENYETIHCELFHNNLSAGTFQLIFNIGLRFNQFSVSDKNKLKIACALLNKMGKFYNLSVAPEYAGDELSNIRMIWEVSAA